MQSAQSTPQNSENQIQRPKSGRKPLQPKNFPATSVAEGAKSKLKQQEWIGISIVDKSNKENQHPVFVYTTPTKVQSLDASLAEELSAIRQKLERLKLDREKTDKFLRDRDLQLDFQIEQLHNRGELQKQLEIEVDRLFRLQELRAWCMKISPIRSLREKQQLEKRDKEEDRSQDINMNDKDQSTAESTLKNSEPEHETQT